MQERRRLEYLQALGIEVWQNKHSLLQLATGTPEAETAIVTQTLPQDRLSEVTEEPVPASLTGIGLGLIRYPGCLAVIDLPVTETTLASGCQQLLDDIVKTLGVDTLQRTMIRETESLWHDGADEALRTRVAQLLGGTNSFLLVFGKAACRLLLGNDVETFTALDWMGRRTVAGGGLEALLQSPALKRSLWLSLQEHLQRR